MTNGATTSLRRQYIDTIQEKVECGEITNITTLEEWCRDTNVDIATYEEVLMQIDYNSCDRCGQLDYSPDLLWLDHLELDETNPKDKALLDGIQAEGIDYCAICDKCASELQEKGGGTQE